MKCPGVWPLTRIWRLFSPLFLADRATRLLCVLRLDFQDDHVYRSHGQRDRNGNTDHRKCLLSVFSCGLFPWALGPLVPHVWCCVAGIVIDADNAADADGGVRWWLGIRFASACAQNAPQFGPCLCCPPQPIKGIRWCPALGSCCEPNT